MNRSGGGSLKVPVEDFKGVYISYSTEASVVDEYISMVQQRPWQAGIDHIDDMSLSTYHCAKQASKAASSASLYEIQKKHLSE